MRLVQNTTKVGGWGATLDYHVLRRSQHRVPKTCADVAYLGGLSDHPITGSPDSWSIKQSWPIRKVLAGLPITPNDVPFNVECAAR